MTPWKRYSASALAAAFCAGQLVLGADAIVAVKRSDEAVPARGADARMTAIQISLPTATIDYHALHHADTGRVISERFDDVRFGLQLRLPAGDSGWNWSTQDFLTFAVRAGGRAAAVLSTWIPSDVSVLETRSRALVVMRWRPDGTHGAPLTLTLLQLPERRGWLFVRLEPPPAWPIESIQTLSYPFVTTGPRERERWAAVPGGPFAISDAPRTLAATDGWIVLHNRFAQERGGSYQVFDSEAFRSVTVGGTYGVGTRFTPARAGEAVTLALGFFTDEPAETAVRMFQMEGAAQVATTLRGMDWTPRFSPADTDPLVARVAALVALEADLAGVAEWGKLRDAYDAACRARAPADVQAVVARIVVFQGSLLRQALDRYR